MLFAFSASPCSDIVEPLSDGQCYRSKGEKEAPPTNSFNFFKLDIDGNDVSHKPISTAISTYAMQPLNSLAHGIFCYTKIVSEFRCRNQFV